MLDSCIIKPFSTFLDLFISFGITTRNLYILSSIFLESLILSINVGSVLAPIPATPSVFIVLYISLFAFATINQLPLDESNCMGCPRSPTFFSDTLLNIDN